MDQIATLAACDVGKIQRYVEAGIFDMAALDEADVTGIRLIGDLIASGILLEVIAEMFAKGEISSGFLRNLTAFPVTATRGAIRKPSPRPASISSVEPS